MTGTDFPLMVALYEDLRLILPAIVLLFPVYGFFLWIAAEGAAAPKWISWLIGLSVLCGLWVFSAALPAPHGTFGPAFAIMATAFGAAVSYEMALRYKGLGAIVGWVFLVAHLVLIGLVVYRGARALRWI